MLCVHNNKTESYMVVGVIGYGTQFLHDKIQKK